MTYKKTMCWTGATGLVLASGVAVAIVMSHKPATASAATALAASGHNTTPIDGNRLARDLLAAGLSPKQLCASGATVAQADAAWIAAAAEARLVASSMDAARSAIETAAMNVQRLERLVRSGRADAGDLTELAAQRSQLATQTALRDGLIADIRAEATSTLDAAIRTKLDELHEPDLGLDAIYRVVSRDQANAVALREAIADVRVSAKHGREPSSESLDLINAAETDPAVAAAKTHMASRLALIKAEWDALLRGE